jgi:oxaloacetate decarboxylase gamma subunit
MSEEYRMAFLLLLVGMTTVFLILILVVTFGRLLIRLVNNYLPEEAKPVVEAVLRTTAVKPAVSFNQLEGSKLSAIIAAVDLTTGGRGKITKIEKYH